MHILALCGSLRPESTTLKALQICARGIESTGATCDLVSGEAMNLPLYRELENEPLPPAVADFKKRAALANGFIWGSPEYHGGYTGVLKNALDWLSAHELAGKPVALIAVSGGAMGANNTLNGLRICARNVNAWVLPQQVSIASSWNAFEDDSLRDEEMEDRLMQLGKRLVAAARVLPQLR